MRLTRHVARFRISVQPMMGPTLIKNGIGNGTLSLITRPRFKPRMTPRLALKLTSRSRPRLVRTLI